MAGDGVGSWATAAASPRRAHPGAYRGSSGAGVGGSGENGIGGGGRECGAGSTGEPGTDAEGGSRNTFRTGRQGSGKRRLAGTGERQGVGPEAGRSADGGVRRDLGEVGANEVRDPKALLVRWGSRGCVVPRNRSRWSDPRGTAEKQGRAKIPNALCSGVPRPGD